MLGRTKHAAIVCSLSVLLGGCGWADAATYYVDQAHVAASDSNAGTNQVAPWKTLDKAFATVAPGDTVYVKGSTNPASPDAIYDRSGKAGLGIVTAGAPGNPITFAVWGGHTVILEGNMSNYGIDLNNASHHRIDGFLIRKFSKAAEGHGAATDVVIENCEFTQTAQTGLRLRNVTDFVMRDCYVHHCWEAGISVRGGFNVTFERVESSYNSDGQGEAGDGDGFHSLGGGDNHTYIDCVARGNSEDGFDLTVNSTLIGCIAEGQTACNIKLWRRDDDNYAPKTMTIINTLVYNAGQAGIKVSRGPGMNLYNCVVYNNREEGVAFRGIVHSVGPTSVTSNIVNCIIAENGWEGIEVLQSGPNTNNVLADHNLYYSNGRANAGVASDTNAATGQDPLFANPIAADFHIGPTSPARDQGTTLAQVTTDFEGDSRPQGAAYDIGADEYVAPASVVGRHVFYNNSYFDGDDPGANASDDAAIAPDKTALLPGGTGNFANYTSYWHGINGIMVDIPALPGVPTAADFTFKVGNDNNPAGWSAAPAPSSITIRSGAGAGGSDRTTIIWAHNAIAKQWLQVTVLATVNTGLSSPDVFYFGNAIGETGNLPSDAEVTPTDEVAVRNDPHTLGGNPATITDACDFNRDRKVGPTDAIICRDNGTSSPTALQLITVP